MLKSWDKSTHVHCRVLLWAHTADQTVAKEDVGGVLRRPCADGRIILVLGRTHVPLQVDDLPPHRAPPVLS